MDFFQTALVCLSLSIKGIDAITGTDKKTTSVCGAGTSDMLLQSLPKLWK